MSERQKRHARYHVRRAVELGLLVPSEDCERCGRIPGLDDPKLHAHHWLGYEPEVMLVVDWLCVSCHSSCHGGVQNLDAHAANTARWGRLTAEERSTFMRQHSANLSPEARQRITAASTIGARSHEYWAQFTPEQRSEILRQRARKAWETRRARSISQT